MKHITYPSEIDGIHVHTPQSVILRCNAEACTVCPTFSTTPLQRMPSLGHDSQLYIGSDARDGVPPTSSNPLPPTNRINAMAFPYC